MSDYIIRTKDGRYDVFNVGQGEGFYNVTRQELENLRIAIEAHLLNEDFDENGNYTGGGK